MNSDDSGLSGLQFDRVEPANSAQLSCVACNTPIEGQYFALNGHTLCPACADMQRPQLAEPSSRDYLRAGLYGAGAALAGTTLYFAILALSGYEIGLIAVAVGWLVGKAVQKGARGIGGRKLQIMAVVLTYFSIAGSYMPLIIKYAIENRPGQQQQQQTKSQTTTPAPSDRSTKAPVVETAAPAMSVGDFAAGLLMLFGYCLILPFMQGLSSIIGLFIIFIGLFEAWKLNRRVPLVLEGPFDAPAPAATA